MKFKKLNKPYIIAEIGINHEGSYSLAKKLIFEAKKAGADAVKFQVFKPNTIVYAVEKNSDLGKTILSHKKFLASVNINNATKFYIGFVDNEDRNNNSFINNKL